MNNSDYFSNLSCRIFCINGERRLIVRNQIYSLTEFKHIIVHVCYLETLLYVGRLYHILIQVAKYIISVYT